MHKVFNYETYNVVRNIEQFNEEVLPKLCEELKKIEGKEKCQLK